MSKFVVYVKYNGERFSHEMESEQHARMYAEQARKMGANVKVKVVRSDGKDR